MKKKKKYIIPVIGFIIGLLIYLVGLFLLFGTTLTKIQSIKKLYPNFVYTRNTIMGIKLLGIILFFIGFIIFMASVIFLYKKDKIKENVKDLIIEGKADVITIIVMTYLLIVMLVLCLVFDQIIGALLFAITILVQSILNTILLKYYKNKIERK